MIRIYQLVLSPILSTNKCRFLPTCSEYGKEALERYGAVKGGIITLKRILRCNPFNKNYGFDPVEKDKQ